MAQFPCLPLWTDAWVADTWHLSEAKLGAYIKLLVLMWRTPYCRVPNDNGWLQEHLGTDKDRLRELYRPVIEEFCSVEGNFIVQHRLQREFASRFQFAQRMSAMRKRAKNNQKGINTGR